MLQTLLNYLSKCFHMTHIRWNTFKNLIFYLIHTEKFFDQRTHLNHMLLHVRISVASVNKRSSASRLLLFIEQLKNIIYKLVKKCNNWHIYWRWDDCIHLLTFLYESECLSFFYIEDGICVLFVVYSLKQLRVLMREKRALTVKID